MLTISYFLKNLTLATLTGTHEYDCNTKNEYSDDECNRADNGDAEAHNDDGDYINKKSGSDGIGER